MQDHSAWRMMQKIAACLKMLQEGQQGMAGIHWLEAAQQISAISLLAQIQDHKLDPHLHPCACSPKTHAPSKLCRDACSPKTHAPSKLCCDT